MSSNKITIIAIVCAVLLIAGALYATSPKQDTSDGYRTFPRSTTPTTEAQEQIGQSTIENNIQYVDVEARAGYFPRVTKAQAGLPTIIRMKTNNTFDCSSALVINDLGFRSFLPATGVTEIEVPTDKAQGTLRGMCSMAMYHFHVDFE